MKSWLPLLKVGAVVWAIGLMGGFVYLRGGGTTPWTHQPTPADARATADDRTALPSSKGGVLSISPSGKLSTDPLEAESPPGRSLASRSSSYSYDDDASAAVRSAARSLAPPPRAPAVMPGSKSGAVVQPIALPSLVDDAPRPTLNSDRLEASPPVQQFNPSLPPGAVADQQVLRPERTIVLSGSKSYTGATVISAGTLTAPDDHVQDAKDVADTAQSRALTVPAASPALRPERTVVFSGSKSLSGVIRSEELSPPDPEQEAKAVADAARLLAQAPTTTSAQGRPERTTLLSASKPITTISNSISNATRSLESLTLQQSARQVGLEQKSLHERDALEERPLPFDRPITLQPQLAPQTRPFQWNL